MSLHVWLAMAWMCVSVCIHVVLLHDQYKKLHNPPGLEGWFFESYSQATRVHDQMIGLWLKIDGKPNL